jgi:general secretion pathway protein K
MKTTGERGFALLIVLWSLVLISLLTMQILAAGRTAAAVADQVRAGAQARARADGAINEALFHLLASGSSHWPPDGTRHILGTADAPVTVKISILNNKINPNLASTGLLAGLFQACGATGAQALQLANSIIEWRSLAISEQAEQAALAKYRQAGLRYGPPGHVFNDLGELAYVIGMPPAQLACATPHMNLYQANDPDPKYSDPVVRQALALSGQPGSNSAVYDGTPPVVSIEADVHGPGKTAARRAAIVSIATNGQPYQFLALGNGY